MRWFYPDRGDFVAFVGNLASRGLVHDAIRTFRGAAAFPSEGAALPAFVTGVGWSDQWSFWQVGYLVDGDGDGHGAVPESELRPAGRPAGHAKLQAAGARDGGAGGGEAREVAIRIGSDRRSLRSLAWRRASRPGSSLTRTFRTGAQMIHPRPESAVNSGREIGDGRHVQHLRRGGQRYGHWGLVSARAPVLAKPN